MKRLPTKPLPTIEYLNECFTLSETSPSGLVWKMRPRTHFDSDLAFRAINGKFAGKNAGHHWVSLDKVPRHYWLVRIARISYKAHRVVYSLCTGTVLPNDVELDHIDGDGLNNSGKNLRPAGREENSYNNRVRSNNTSGHKGIYWDKSMCAWVGRVKANGKRTSTGACPSLEVAVRLTQELRASMHGSFTNHG